MLFENVDNHSYFAWSEFTIWNAGKHGRRFYRSLRIEDRKMVFVIGLAFPNHVFALNDLFLEALNNLLYFIKFLWNFIEALKHRTIKMLSFFPNIQRINMNRSWHCNTASLIFRFPNIYI